MADLKTYLSTVQPGEIDDPNELERILAHHWDSLKGWRMEGMSGFKLINRMEDVRWNPPILSFVLERHGGTAMGSTRAELQHWEVNVKEGWCGIVKRGRRQVRSMAKGVSVKPVAAETAQMILGGKQDDRLKWDKDGCVKVRPATLFPDDGSFKITISGRRKKFRQFLAEMLMPHGWEWDGMNGFRKSKS